MTGERFHELCLYFLVDVSHTTLPDRGETFAGPETHNGQVFTWMPFDRVEQAYLYPLFLKKQIRALPEHLTLMAEYE